MFKDTYSRSSVDLQTEKTTANESDVTEKNEEEASVYKQTDHEFGVDLAAEELRLEDELKDRDVEYTYEYLS